MSRERAQIDLGGPLLREREGVKLTERSLSARLAEVIERLQGVVEAAAPSFSDKEWSLVSWAGWDAIQAARVTQQPRDADAIAWMDIAAEASERGLTALSARLRAMGPIERVAVLERIEAYGRTEAMRIV